MSAFRAPIEPRWSILCAAVRLLAIVAFLCAGGVAWGEQFEWQEATPESQGISSRKLELLKESLASRNTKAFLVIRNDQIVYEWYAAGHGATKAHYTASMAKAIVGGLSLAVALTDRRIALDDNAATYISQWKEDARKSKITSRQLGSHRVVRAMSRTNLSEEHDSGGNLPVHGGFPDRLQLRKRTGQECGRAVATLRPGGSHPQSEATWCPAS